jgi:hypothetical protein
VVHTFAPCCECPLVRLPLPPVTHGSRPLQGACTSPRVPRLCVSWLCDRRRVSRRVASPQAPARRRPVAEGRRGGCRRPRHAQAGRVRARVAAQVPQELQPGVQAEAAQRAAGCDAAGASRSLAWRRDGRPHGVSSRARVWRLQTNGVFVRHHQGARVVYIQREKVLNALDFKTLRRIRLHLAQVRASRRRRAARRPSACRCRCRIRHKFARRMRCVAAMADGLACGAAWACAAAGGQPRSQGRHPEGRRQGGMCAALIQSPPPLHSLSAPHVLTVALRRGAPARCFRAARASRSCTARSRTRAQRARSVPRGCEPRRLSACAHSVVPDCAAMRRACLTPRRAELCAACLPVVTCCAAGRVVAVSSRVWRLPCRPWRTTARSTTSRTCWPRTQSRCVRACDACVGRVVRCCFTVIPYSCVQVVTCMHGLTLGSGVGIAANGEVRACVLLLLLLLLLLLSWSSSSLLSVTASLSVRRD